MDLVFNRYSSPFVLIDGLIQIQGLNDFITELWDIVNEEKLWDYFLHKVFDKSWGEFLDECTVSEPSEPIDLGATVKKSRNMLNNFTPESEV